MQKSCEAWVSEIVWWGRELRIPLYRSQQLQAQRARDSKRTAREWRWVCESERDCAESHLLPPSLHPPPLHPHSPHRQAGCQSNPSPHQAPSPWCHFYTSITGLSLVYVFLDWHHTIGPYATWHIWGSQLSLSCREIYYFVLQMHRKRMHQKHKGQSWMVMICVLFYILTGDWTAIDPGISLLWCLTRQLKVTSPPLRQVYHDSISVMHTQQLPAWTFCHMNSRSHVCVGEWQDWWIHVHRARHGLWQ